MALTYEVLTITRSGRERAREYTADEPLDPGDVFVLDGRFWLVDRVEPSANGDRPRAFAKPGRYRLRLRHPDGHEELGSFRRLSPDRPKLGHAFSTLEDGRPVSWSVLDERLAHDEGGEPYLDLIAGRDFSEVEEVPDHELEHTLERGDDRRAAAEAAIARAGEQGLEIELVALDAGEAPDWEAAERFIDALILEEIEDDLVEQCGVEPDSDPHDTWLEIIKDRLRADLQRFRADIEGDHDQIEEWDFADSRVFASVGTFEDEADPDSGHGWMCRLLDSEALGAAGFARVRKAQL